MGWSYSHLATGENLEHVLQHVEINDEGLFQVKDGSFRFLSNSYGTLFNETNGKWEINENYVKSIRRDGVKFEKGTKLFQCQPLDDPVTGPNSDLIKETTEMMLEGSGTEIEYFHCGHLAALPNIPIVEKSFMRFNEAKFQMSWSRNETDDEKIKEGHELR